MERRLQDLPLMASTDFTSGGYAKCYEYLARRGVKTPQEIDKLGIRILRAVDIGKEGDDRAALVFPHYDRAGAMMDWWSARMVEVTDAKPTGFAGMTVPEKHRGKMYCPARYPPEVYFPRTIDWSEIAHGAVIYIHESAMKAIAGARLLTYSVGLNGVWGWGSKKHQIALLDSLKDLPWAQRALKCCVVFDSNAAGNDQVALAIAQFAERMQLICKVTVQHACLPKSPENEDWGFDDYCVRHGDAVGLQWLTDLASAPPVDSGQLTTMRLQLNNEVCIVRNIKKIVSQMDGTQMGKSEFTDINYAHMQAWVGDTAVSAPKSWLTWERRRVVERLEYTPGGEALVDGEYLNLWKGMGVEPEEGDASLWLELLQRVVPDDELRRWVIQWFAYPLQNLGCKLNTYIHMFGPPGGGKNALLAPFMGIYGENAVTIGRETISSDFNETYAMKQLVNIDELHSGSGNIGQVVNNKIKMLTTSPKLLVNGKGKSGYYINNHANIVTTANYSDAIRLDENDRRCLVLRIGTPDTVIKDKAYWIPYFKWALSAQGQAALYHYLCGVDLGDFDAGGWAPLTEEKEDITDATRHPMEKWAKQLREDPDSVLPSLMRGVRVFTPEQMAMAYVADDPMGRVTPGLKNALGQKLRDAGIPTERIKIDGVNKKVWVLLLGHTTMEMIRAEMAKLKGKV